MSSRFWKFECVEENEWKKTTIAVSSLSYIKVLHHKMVLNVNQHYTIFFMIFSKRKSI
jgi:hypothetical protein